MAIIGDTFTKIEKSDRQIKEELIKILSYIASMSFIFVVIFTIVSITLPESITRDFRGIEIDFPFVGIVNFILSFMIHSIYNLFTYLFLVIIGVIAFMGAQKLEDQMEGASKSRTKGSKDNFEVLENRTIVKESANLSPAEKASTSDKLKKQKPPEFEESLISISESKKKPV